MKRIVILPTIFTILFVALSSSFTQESPVDFGDSGITVVVEPEPKGDGKEISTVYIPFVPDEFLTFFPEFPFGPNLPWPPPWDADKTLCEGAIARLAELTRKRSFWIHVLVNNLTFEPGEPAFYYQGYGTDGRVAVMAGSPTFAKSVLDVFNTIQEIDKEIEEVSEDIEDLC